MRSARFLHCPKPIYPKHSFHPSLINSSINSEDNKLRELAAIECEITLRTSHRQTIKSPFTLHKKTINPPKRPKNPMIRDLNFESIEIETDTSIEYSEIVCH